MARKVKRYLEQQERLEITNDNIPQFYVGIYSRLSVDHDDRKTESIENQINIVRQYIEENNKKPDKAMKLEIHDIYIDKGVSGTSFKREGFERMMADVRNHDVDCIIVKDLSRFGRDYLETGNYIEKIFPFLGVRFISVTDGFDSMSKDASNEKMAMNIKNLVNDMYAKDISKRVTIARKIAAENGSFIGSFAPYGYSVWNMEGKRNLVIEEEAAAIVRYIFESFVSQIKIKEIAARLYEQKVHRISDYNKYGHCHCISGEILHQWNNSVIHSVLKNPSYVGDLVQVRTKSKMTEGQKGVRKATKDELVTIKNNHEAIIDREMFNIAQKMLERGKNVSDSKHRKLSKREYENVFRNVVYCGKCGHKMKSVYYESRITGDRNYGYYCNGAYYFDERKCSKNYVKEEQLESYVKERIQQIFSDWNIKQKNLCDLNHKICLERVQQCQVEMTQLDEDSSKMLKQSGEIYMKLKEGLISREEYLLFHKNKVEHDDFAAKRKAGLLKKIKVLERREKEENTFLRSLLKVNSDKKLNAQIVEILIDKILIYPEGIIEINFKFNQGEADYGD